MTEDVRVWQEKLEIHAKCLRTMVLYISGYPNFKNEFKARQAKKWIATMAKKWQAPPFKGVYKGLVWSID